MQTLRELNEREPYQGFRGSTFLFLRDLLAQDWFCVNAHNVKLHNDYQVESNAGGWLWHSPDLEFVGSDEIQRSTSVQ